MSPRLVGRLLVIAAAMTLAGLGFVLWGLFGRGPIPIFMSMTLGQGIGVCAFALYLFVVFTELWSSPSEPATEPPAAATDAPTARAEEEREE